MPVLKSNVSLRSVGKSTVAIDLPTRAKLKELAGDMPVSHYLRMIAFGTDKPGAGQTPLPGQEHLSSPNTIASVNAKLDKVITAIGKMDSFVDSLVNEMSGGRLGVAGVNGQESALVDNARTLSKAVKKVANEARSIASVENSQGELDLA